MGLRNYGQWKVGVLGTLSDKCGLVFGFVSAIIKLIANCLLQVYDVHRVK